MTKYHAFLLLVFALLVGKGVQYWTRRKVHDSRSAKRNLSVLDLILIVCIVGLGIFLGTTSFSDWLTIKPVQIGIIMIGMTVGILYACPGRQAIRPFLALLIWFVLDNFRPWIVQRQIFHTVMRTWAISTLLILTEICLGSFIAYRLLRGAFIRHLESVHGPD